MKKGALGLLLALMAASAAAAEDFYLAVDVPHNLAGLTTLPPHWLLQHIGSSYGGQGPIFPEGAEVSGLHYTVSGEWLLAPAFPVTVGGLEVEPRDVVSTPSQFGPFTLVLDGSAAGIPETARIDSIFLDPAEQPVLSFDAPVQVGGLEVGPSDLVRYEGGTSFSLY